METFSTADSLTASQSELQDRFLLPTQNVGPPSQNHQYGFDSEDRLNEKCIDFLFFQMLILFSQSLLNQQICNL